MKYKVFEGKEEGDDEVLPGLLMIKADGRVERMSEWLPASSTFVNGTASKDVVIDPELGLRARIFVPEVIASENTKKLPVVVYFHGGGFCLGDYGE
jgi:acetyl esterase/lipase